MTGILIKGEEFGYKHIDTQGECHVVMEGKTGEMYLEARD